MHSFVAGRVAIAAGLLVLSGYDASACGLWLCDAERSYAFIPAPRQDPRLGPVWTSNGWSYPDPYLAAEPAPFYAGPSRQRVWERERGTARSVDLK